MRVTKTIREFIEKEVSNRLDAKYAAEKEEADFQVKVAQEVENAAMDAAQKAYDKYMASVFAQYDFLEDLHTNKERRCVELNRLISFCIKDRLDYNNVQSGADARPMKQGLSSMTLSWNWSLAAIRRP